MSCVLAPSLLPPIAIALAFLEMFLIEVMYWHDWAEASVEALGGWVRPRMPADMVLALVGGVHGDAERKGDKLQC